MGAFRSSVNNCSCRSFMLPMKRSLIWAQSRVFVDDEA
jgi:hypothetical protein